MHVCTYVIGQNNSRERIDPCPKAKISNINYQQDAHDYKEVPHLEFLHKMIETSVIDTNVHTPILHTHVNLYL